MLRPLGVDDLAAAHELSRAVNWPHRREDWQFVHSLGRGVGAVAGGALVGTALCWPFGPAAATLGMVIVAPDRQGRGVGRRLMDAALAEAGDRAILLNATASGVPLYERLGFRRFGLVHQHQGAGFSVPVAPLGAGERIRPVGRGDEPALAALDAAATGLPRAPAISALLAIAEGVVLDRGGEAVGFALFRRFGRGYVIGPVVAPGIDSAKALISHWVGSRSGMFIRIDVPADCGLSGWLHDLGLARVSEVATMVRGEPPARSSRVRSFALINQALG